MNSGSRGEERNDIGCGVGAKDNAFTAGLEPVGERDVSRLIAFVFFVFGAISTDALGEIANRGRIPIQQSTFAPNDDETSVHLT